MRVWRGVNHRDHRNDPTATTNMLTQLRGDAYPPTKPGIRLAILDLVPHVRRCEVHERFISSDRPLRLYIDLRLPWWAFLTFGILRVITKRRVMRVFNRFCAAGMSDTLVEIGFAA